MRVVDLGVTLGHPAGVLFAQTSTTTGSSSSMVYVIVIAIAGLLSGVAVIAAARGMKRRVAIEDIARKAGLKYAEEDPFGCTRIRFPLFTKGDGRGAENVLWIEHPDGRSFRAFDYYYFVEHSDDEGRTYHRFSCALAYMGSSWPELSIVKEGLAEKALSALGEGDIDFESEEFNRTFAVRCADRRFATAFLDARMIDLLLTTKGELSFAFIGRWMLVWRKPVPPRLVPGLLAVAEKVVAAIPNVAWELYPSNFKNDDGTVLPDVDMSLLAHLEPSVVLAQREEDAAKPKVEYDLDGHPIKPVEEDPWGAGHAPPDHERP